MEPAFVLPLCILYMIVIIYKAKDVAMRGEGSKDELPI
jgi:hypothetical protein